MIIVLTEKGKPMDDLISRQDAVKSMTNAIWHYPNEIYAQLNSYEMAEALAKDGLMFIPSAQKKGHWIDASTTREQKWKCSECGEETTSSAMGLPRYRFCPMCGAYMRGGNDG